VQSLRRKGIESFVLEIKALVGKEKTVAELQAKYVKILQGRWW